MSCRCSNCNAFTNYNYHNIINTKTLLLYFTVNYLTSFIKEHYVDCSLLSFNTERKNNTKEKSIIGGEGKETFTDGVSNLYAEAIDVAGS